MDKLLTIFKVPELRRKILFTAMLLAIYRIGFYVPLPIVNQDRLQSWEEQQSSDAAGKLFGTVAMFGGTSDRHEHDLRPGDHALHLRLDHLPAPRQRRPIARSDDEGGRERAEKINEYTRYATVALCAIQSAFWVQYMMSPQHAAWCVPRVPGLLARVGLRLHHDGRHRSS